MPASLLAIWRMLQVQGLLVVPVAICAVLWVVAALQVFEAGNLMQPFQVALQGFLIALANALGLPGTSAT